VKFLHNLDLAEDVKENIAWKTAAKLFRIDVPGAAEGPPAP